MAREKLSDADANADDTPARTGEEQADSAAQGEPEEEPTDAGDDAARAKKSTKSGKFTKSGKSSNADKVRQARRTAGSATARRAEEARATMQRQHRQIDFARAAAVGVEAVGAAGLVAASLLPWAWNEPLWGREDGAGVTVQVTLALAVLGLVGGWAARDDWWRTASRTVALLAAGVVAFGSAAAVWQTPPGGRGPGGLVATVAALLLIAGGVGWLLERRRLRKLFAFGMGYARAQGYGNLAAVKRARMIGGPVGAVAAAAVVTGALVVVPGLVSTEDATTAPALVLEGAPPTGGLAASWEVDLAASADPPPTVRASAGGLVVDEAHGVQLVDPADGETRWHWRDDSYQRTLTLLAGDRGTVVVALRLVDGGDDGRDRVVGLDATTGEVRWDRFDNELYEAVTSLGVAPTDGDWLAVPGSAEVPELPEGAPADPTLDPAAATTLHGAWVLSAADGETRWRDHGTEGCVLDSIGADHPDALVLVETCPPEEGTPEPETCQVTGLDAADGSELWSWPDTERVDPQWQHAAGCQVTALGGVAFLSYQVGQHGPDPAAPPDEEAEEEETDEAEDPDQGEPADEAAGQPPVLALDPATGEELWAAHREEDSHTSAGVDGLNNPQVVAGDTVVGIEWPSGQPGVGASVMMLRDLADGSLAGEVELPEGQSITTRAAGDSAVLITHYVQEQDEVYLLEVDVAEAEVVSETLVVAGAPDAILASAGLAVGPGTVAVDTMIAPGQDAGPDDLRLFVHGFA